MVFKTIQYNTDFMKNIDDELLNGLIYLNDNIPDDLQNRLTRNISGFRKSRREFVYYHEDILKKIWDQRYVIDSCNGVDATMEKKIEFVMEFIEKYPQFKKFVKGINYYNKNLEVVSFEELK